MRRKVFTIITVTYNAENLVENTMKSIFSQTYTDYEYIVIDGNSTDNTMDIIKQYRDKIDILISEKDNGIYDAMNKGIKFATGQYINFMNCGDYFVNNEVLEKVSKKIQEDSAVIYGNAIYHTVVGKYRVYPSTIDKTIQRRMPFNHQCTFVKTEIAKNHLFDTTYKVSADYNMFLSLYKEGFRFHSSKPFFFYA